MSARKQVLQILEIRAGERFGWKSLFNDIKDLPAAANCSWWLLLTIRAKQPIRYMRASREVVGIIRNGCEFRPAWKVAVSATSNGLYPRRNIVLRPIVLSQKRS